MNGGGIGSFVKFLGEKLVENDIVVSVIGFYNVPSEQLESVDGISVYRLPRSRWKFARFYDNTKRLLKKIDEINEINTIDIVEGSELNFAFFSKKTPYKKIIRLHGGHHFFAKELGKKPALWRGYQEKASFSRADGFIAVSNYVGTQTKKYLNLNFKFTTIYNSVDFTKFKRNTSTKLKKNTLLFVGTICEKKGVRQLVQAIPMIKKQFPDVVLNIIGRDWKFLDGSSYIEYLKSFVLQEDKESIHIIGPKPHSEIPLYIAEADVCVYPSHMEAMPIAWIEALVMGKKVVASRIGPALELIKDKETALLVDPYSSEDIANKIIEVLSNAKEAQIRADNSSKDMLLRFNPEEIVFQNINFYKSML